MLPPVGIVNETHEPPTFNGVDRPLFDHDVLPTTWRELGIGAVGTLPGSSGLSYRVCLLNGLKAEGFDALMQVSVLARTGVEADALSTAMLVSGKPFEGVLRFYSA